MASLILGPIRNAYVALHQDSDSAPTRFFPSTGDQDDLLLLSPSYPMCNVASHIHDDSASASFTRTNPHDGSALVPASLANPSAPSSSVPPSPHAVKNFGVPPLEDDTHIPGQIHTHQTTIKDPRIPVTSPDPLTTRVIQDSTNTSTGTIPLSVPDIFASTLSTSEVWTNPNGVTDVKDATSSDAPDALSSPSPVPVLDDMFPTGPLLPSNSPVTVSDHASLPESHSSAASPDQYRPRLSSAPDLSPVAEGEGGASSTLHEGKDTFHPPSTTFDDIMATPDPPPHSPSPKPTTDVTTTGPSQRSLDA
ncbi:hypothetical protein EDB87DRAFT_1632623 [Lactarius vividus]|nr:hypothetical protein EDB87DRAFT_1632623 [Lactarius vividus]